MLRPLTNFDINSIFNRNICRSRNDKIPSVAVINLDDKKVLDTLGGS